MQCASISLRINQEAHEFQTRMNVIYSFMKVIHLDFHLVSNDRCIHQVISNSVKNYSTYD